NDTRALIDVDGSVVLSGETSSHDFPVTPGALGSEGGLQLVMMFLSRLSADGQSLLASGLLEGDGLDIRGIALAPSGGVVVCAASPFDMPVTAGAFDAIHDANDDGVILCFDEDFTKVVA